MTRLLPLGVREGRRERPTRKIGDGVAMLIETGSSVKLNPLSPNLRLTTFTIPVLGRDGSTAPRERLALPGVSQTLAMGRGLSNREAMRHNGFAPLDTGGSGETEQGEQLVADGGVRWIDLTAFQQQILRVLAEEPMYGLRIKRELTDRYQQEINHGRLYPNLDDLVEHGLVDKSQLDQRTNQYELTNEAKVLLQREQRRWSQIDVETEAVADGGESA